MKVLLISTSERTGGAAIACNRLLHALNKAGCDATMLVRDKQTDNEKVYTVNDTWLRRKINYARFLFERLLLLIKRQVTRDDLFKVSVANMGIDISNHPLVREADIIHLHWVNQGMLSLKNIQQLLNTGKPICWTLHDMWTVTGICHYSRGCQNYQQGCGNCFFLNTPKANDLSSQIFAKKQNLYKDQQMQFIACSNWLKDIAKQSNLKTALEPVSIPNPIDVSQFQPLDKQACRKKLGLPENKKLILFGSAKITDPIKGINYFIKAAQVFAQNYPQAKDEVELVIFGKTEEDVSTLFPFKVTYLQYVNNLEDLIGVYNLADLFVHPSLEDNLPNTLMEALSCGIPCVGFDTGGVPEMIDHKENGYIAGYKSAEDMAQGIYWTLFNTDYNRLSENARKKVVENYSEKKVANQYINVYKKLLS